MHIDPSEVQSSLSVTGIANIPNQTHRKTRVQKHCLNLALIGEAGMGKTRFINNCLKQAIFPVGETRRAGAHEPGKEIELRIRRASKPARRHPQA